jgi:hypothetical protein
MRTNQEQDSATHSSIKGKPRHGTLAATQAKSRKLAADLNVAR